MCLNRQKSLNLFRFHFSLAFLFIGASNLLNSRFLLSYKLFDLASLTLAFILCWKIQF